MYVVHVSVRVKPGCEEAFRAATLENARKSLKEPGVARFDVLRLAGEPERFLLAEVYRTEADAGRHKETPHYAAWRDAVADMMAVPRSSEKYASVFPDDAGWG